MKSYNYRRRSHSHSGVALTFIGTTTGVLLVGFLLNASPAFAAEPELKNPVVYAKIKLEKELPGSNAHFSPDGKSLAFIEGGLGGNKIILWDVAKKERTAAFATEHCYRELVWSPDGGSIYAADFGSVFRIDVATGKRTKLYGHDNCVHALKYLPDTKQLVSGALNGGIVVWDAAKDKLVKEMKCPEGELAVVLDLQPVPGTSKLAVAAEYGTLQVDGPKMVITIHTVLYLADLADGTFATAREQPPVCGIYRQLAASHFGGEYGFADPKKEEVVLTDATTGKSRTIKDCPLVPFACRFSPSDRYLFVGGCEKDNGWYSLSGAIAVYDLTAEKWVGRFATKGATVRDLSYSEATNLLTFTSGAATDRDILIWDMKGIVDPSAKK